MISDKPVINTERKAQLLVASLGIWISGAVDLAILISLNNCTIFRTFALFLGQNEVHCRHFGSKRVLRRKFLGHWLSRYPNSSSTFKLSRLPISCDVNPNSDPTTKCDCPSCSRTVARNHRALDCNLCRGTFHIKCGNVAPTEFKQMQKSKQKSWSCPTCTERQF